MIAELDLVNSLQSVDRRIGELEREISALPRHVAQIEKALESHNRRLEADRAALAANQKERKSLESAIQVQEQKISKLKGQMIEAKTNEVYRAFQHEIEYCEQAIRKAEDRILDLMAESEPLDINVKAAETALKKEKQQVDAEKVKAHDRTAADRAQLELLQAERATIVGGMKTTVYSAYERILKKWKNGVVMAEALDGRCSACQISLRPQFLQDLRKCEDLMFCESCGRMLYYNPPVAFDDQIAAQPGAPHPTSV